MCIAILKTKEGNITDQALRNSFRANPDGAGIACTVNGKVKVVKGIFDENRFVELVRQAEKVCDNNILIHCRIGTSGLKDFNNTHPFVVKGSVILAHNGILDVDVPKNSKVNDTQIFIKDYLQDFSEQDLMYNKALHKLIGEVIGTNNKFILMNSKGDYTIINEQQGHWLDGVWYSNYGYTTANKWNFACDDDYMYTGYGLSERRITKDEYAEILDAINTLTEEDMEKLGWYPSYDFVTSRLCMENEIETAVPLDELSQDLYDYYLEYSEYLEECKMYDKVENDELELNDDDEYDEAQMLID